MQQPLPAESWPDEGTVGCAVYREGFATALTVELLPEYSLAEHLWFGPGYDDWLADCERLRANAQAAIYQDLDSEDTAVVDRYTAMGSERDLPTRVGYFVGTRLIQDLRRDHTWAELARWSTARAMDELRRSLLG